MNFLDKIKQAFFRLNTAQQISAGLLVICVPLLIALSANALTTAMAYKETPSDTSSESIAPSSSEIISSSEEESSSLEESSSAEPIEIFLKPSSVEEDLEVQIVDKNDMMVTGYDFILTVTGKESSYTSTWTVNDGFLRLTKLDAGDYIVTIEDAEGYIINEKSVECTVKEKVKYEKVDVADKIKDETEIDVSKEDASLTKPVATPEPTPVLPNYADKTATVTKEITAYKYKAKVSSGDFAETDVGYLYNKDGSKSSYIAKVDANGFIVGDIRVLSSSSSSASAASELSVSSTRLFADQAVWDYSLRNLYRTNSFKVIPLTVTGSSSAEADIIPYENTDENTGSEQSSQTPEICPDCQKEKTENCANIYCTVCSEHAGHSADAHCTKCGEIGHKAEDHCAKCDAVGHTAEAHCSVCDSLEHTSAECPSNSSSESSSESSSDSASDSESNSNSESNSDSDSTSESESESETSSETVTKPSYANTVKANIYDAGSAKITDSVLKALDITESHETKDVYKGGWNSDKTSYYLDDGSLVKGQAIIGGATYNFDSDGVVVKNVAKGIDVSKYQPNVNWAQVKASGVDYVIIRVGYRGYGSGVMVEDPYFKSHIAGARAAGLKVGVYFYSQAVTVEEAVEEASMAIQLCNSYKLHYPIYFDTEATGTGAGRADGLSKTQRTAIANAFCQTVRNSGYKAGVYASKSWFYYQLDYSQLSQYDIWLAHYTSSTDFQHRYDMWQYTGSGSCPGIPNAVDLNWAYKVY